LAGGNRNNRHTVISGRPGLIAGSWAKDRGFGTR
jgi:hypothetical protein